MDNTNKDFYNSSDSYFNIINNRSESDYINVIDVVNQYIPKKSKLLEFGCGTGNLAYRVAENEYRVIGIDISERFINYAKEVYTKKDVDLDFQTVDSGKLPFPDSSFDCIYTCAVLEHCYEIDKILTDFDRLLKPGAFLVICTPNLLSPFTRLAMIFSRISGKRKRFHLYGSPSFFVKSVWYTLKKSFLQKTNLIYVTPKYKDFSEADEDVTYLSNPFDYIHILKALNYRIFEVSRGSSQFGKKISKIFPKLSGEVLIVAKKNSVVEN